MRKNLIYASVLAALLAFAGCSDDEKSWEKLPQTEIKSENITFTGTGNATGTIQLATTNSQSGVLNLNNIVFGCENVAVNVSLTDKGDDSFDFYGTQVVDESSKAEGLATVRTVKVSGNITIDGRATVHVSTEASGGLVGIWNLTDTIIANDEFMDTINSSPLILRWGADFVGKERGTDGIQLARVASVIGSPILAEVLGNVNFNADGNITAAYYSNLPFDGDSAMGWIMGHIINITISVSHTDWYESPKDLAYWYAKGDYIYVIPNIEQIIKQVSSDAGKTDTTDYTAILTMIKSMANATDEQIQQMLVMAGSAIDMDLSMVSPALVKQVIGWMNNGIPLKYRDGAYGLEVYLDKEMLEPFMPVVFALLPMLQEKLDAMAAEQPLISLLPVLLSLNKLTDIETIWKTNTPTFELGLTLQN